VAPSSRCASYAFDPLLADTADSPLSSSSSSFSPALATGLGAAGGGSGILRCFRRAEIRVILRSSGLLSQPRPCTPIPLTLPSGLASVDPRLPLLPYPSRAKRHIAPRVRPSSQHRHPFAATRPSESRRPSFARAPSSRRPPSVRARSVRLLRPHRTRPPSTRPARSPAEAIAAPSKRSLPFRRSPRRLRDLCLRSPPRRRRAVSKAAGRRRSSRTRTSDR
jgi:hypothetical protein